MPPTTPPAIAPALDDFLDVPDVPEPPPLTPEVVVGVAKGVLKSEYVEAGVLVLVAKVPVGLVTVAVDAGAAASSCAAAALKVSLATTSKYAQAGMAVPDGICSGNWDLNTCEQLVCQELHDSTARL